uniref:Uncharacterized protein n=2 Tax=Arundo donax TaxID=35708 RepID=A0A0A9DIP1_ARUDO
MNMHGSRLDFHAIWLCRLQTPHNKLKSLTRKHLMMLSRWVLTRTS